MFLPKNLETLQAMEPPPHCIASGAFQVMGADMVELGQTEAGDYSVALNGQWLHDPQGAAAEAATLVSQLAQPGWRSLHVVLGLGLGYVVDELFQCSGGKIFILEPSLSVLQFALENVDLSEFFASGRVWLATSADELMEQIGSRYVFGDHFDVVPLPNYLPLLGNVVDTLMPRLVGLVEEKQRNYQVGFTFDVEWFAHFLKNLPYFRQSQPFDGLKGILTDEPTVVVSAGPSLDDVMPQLKAVRHAIRIVAVGAALRALLNHGIEPDFVVFLDFQGPRQQLVHLHDQCGAARFLLGPYVEGICHQVPNRGNIWLQLENHPAFTHWLKEVVPPNRLGTPIPSGSSVSVLALECALAMGANPIILVGQDLALRGTQKYAGNVHVELTEEGKLRLEDSETTVARHVKVETVLGQNGETLKTSGDYVWIRQQLEERATHIHHEFPTVALWNASVGGAHIEGIPLRPFEDFDWASASTLPELEEVMAAVSPVRVDRDGERDVLAQAVQSLETTVRHWLELLKDLMAFWDGPQAQHSSAPQYLQCRKDLVDRIQGHQLLKAVFAKLIWEWAQNLPQLHPNQQDVSGLEGADRGFYEACTRLIEEELIPAIQAADEALSRNPAGM